MRCACCPAGRRRCGAREHGAVVIHTLWVLIRRQVETFMLELFGNGALMGNSPKQAFYVRCGSDTTTQADLDLGVVNVEVGFAPIKPAEFLVLAIRQLTGRNASR